MKGQLIYLHAVGLDSDEAIDRKRGELVRLG